MIGLVLRELFLLIGLGFFQADARHVQLDNRAVVNQAIDRRGRRHRVFEYLLPF